MKNKKELLIHFDSVLSIISILYKDIEVMIMPEGLKLWYLNGILHNENGPALIFKDGEEYWYKNGTPCTKEELEKKN